MKRKSKIDKDIDWNKEAYVTVMELIQMGGARAEWFYNQPKIWIHKLDTDCMFNLAHPDNKEMLLEILMKEAGIKVVYEDGKVWVQSRKII